MNPQILRLETYKQPSGFEITLQGVGMDWSATTNLCVERLVRGQVQEGWYGWELSVLNNIWNGWREFEQRIGSILV